MSGKNAVTKVGRAIDWDFLSKVVLSEEGKRELAKLRLAYDDVSYTLETKLNLKPAAINWDFYKQKLNPNIVNIFQKSIESLKVPEYDDKYTPEFQKKHHDLVASAGASEELSKEALTKIDAELADIRKHKESLRTQTVDAYLKDHPEVEQKIRKELEAGDWSY
eukprot:TRINITY_DN15697_c0_g1_i1.p1 TRINITY_DN15697_c0_g1~~TRINITY_DN15697_c0_g1_i1.p1  ORF type:complete len:164 (+),score=44.49 TRINITY_DN15697_c0_g1_i1:180-671(+)